MLRTEITVQNVFKYCFLGKENIVLIKGTIAELFVFVLLAYKKVR